MKIQTLQLKKYFVKVKKVQKILLRPELRKFFQAPKASNSQGRTFSSKHKIFFSFLWVIIAFLEPEPPDPIYKRMVQDAIKCLKVLYDSMMNIRIILKRKYSVILFSSLLCVTPPSRRATTLLIKETNTDPPCFLPRKIRSATKTYRGDLRGGMRKSTTYQSALLFSRKNYLQGKPNEI